MFASLNKKKILCFLKFKNIGHVEKYSIGVKSTSTFDHSYSFIAGRIPPSTVRKVKSHSYELVKFGHAVFTAWSNSNK
jgi:hypothetical protein